MSWRRALVAAGIVAAFAGPVAQAPPQPAGDPHVHYHIGRTVDCDQLRQWYSEHHAAWKAEVRHHRPSADQLAYMAAIQQRLEVLGECDAPVMAAG